MFDSCGVTTVIVQTCSDMLRGRVHTCIFDVLGHVMSSCYDKFRHVVLTYSNMLNDMFWHDVLTFSNTFHCFLTHVNNISVSCVSIRNI